MNFSNYLEKLRALPDSQKKIVLWTIVVILAFVMGLFWIRGAINSFSKIGESVGQIKIPQIDTSGVPSMPSLDILQTATPSDQNITPNK